MGSHMYHARAAYAKGHIMTLNDPMMIWPLYAKRLKSDKTFEK